MTGREISEKDIENEESNSILVTCQCSKTETYKLDKQE